MYHNFVSEHHDFLQTEPKKEVENQTLLRLRQELAALRHENENRKKSEKESIDAKNQAEKHETEAWCILAETRETLDQLKKKQKKLKKKQKKLKKIKKLQKTTATEEVSNNLNIGDELIKFELSEANRTHTIGKITLDTWQYGKIVKKKIVKKGTKVAIKLIFVISDGVMYDVLGALDNPDFQYLRTMKAKKAKKQLCAVPPTQKEKDLFVNQVNEMCNEMCIDAQSRWDNTTSSRWTKALGRKGDTRAKGSVDILKSVVDAPLCDEIISKLKELRGDIETISKKIFRTNNILCLYCGQNNATEKDHYMSVVRNGKMNMYLDVNTNWVPSCSECNRSSGKDNKNSLQDPLAWWKDEDESLRSKHPTHPQNILAKDPKALRERGIIMQNFDDFFHVYAPKLPEKYWSWLKLNFDNTLDEAYANMKKCFGEFDKRDEEYKLEHNVTLDLVAKMNEKFQEEQEKNKNTTD